MSTPAASARPVGSTSMHVTGDVVGHHPCPACGSTVAQVYRPGRGRVYCANACRQRAYRWRKANAVRLCVERTGPTERLINDRRHALRHPSDPAARVRDRHGRELAACGAFGRPARNGRFTHIAFVPEHDWSCDSCIDLIGVGPFGSGIPEVVRRFWPADAPSSRTRSRTAGSGWSPPRRAR